MPDVFALPFIEPLTAVPDEEVDEVEDKEELEFERCALLRGAPNMALTSSCMELRPLELHPERVCGG